MRLTVILPFFNEEALLPSLPGVFDRIRAALGEHEVRLLAIDDGSTDGTRAGLVGLDVVLDVVAHETNRGVGAAIATGINEATGDAVVIYDPDEAYPAEALKDLVAALEDADLATLSPYHPDGRVEGVGWLRRLLSRGASWLTRPMPCARKLIWL